MDVTFEQIQEDILQYINSEGLNIEVRTPEYLYRSQVNPYANPGDCIAYKMKDALDIYHVAFVQSKSNGLIYCTQHTTDYYNLKFNDRVSESYMNSRLVIVIDVTK